MHGQRNSVRLPSQICWRVCESVNQVVYEDVEIPSFQSSYDNCDDDKGEELESAEPVLALDKLEAEEPELVLEACTLRMGGGT